MVGRALGRKDKGDWTPAERVEDDEKVHANDGKDGIAVKRTCRRVHSLVDADVEHGECLSGGADQERPLEVISIRKSGQC